MSDRIFRKQRNSRAQQNIEQPTAVFKIAQRPVQENDSREPSNKSDEAARSTNTSQTPPPPVRILLGSSAKKDVADEKFIEKTNKPKEIPAESSPKSLATPRNVSTKALSLALSAVVNDSTSSKPMASGAQLFDEGSEFTELLKDYLSNSNKKYTVIGAIGAQGTGKSTILSMLAGNEPMDLYRQYIFRPCSREAVESCRYQTVKVYFYISPKTRTIFLDCQALNCTSLFEDYLRSHRRQISPADSFELNAIQLLVFLTKVCHTLLFCVDWFIDLSVVRKLMLAELFSNFLDANEENSNRKVNLVVLHQRAKAADFQPALVDERMRILNGIFENSRFDVNGNLTMAKLGFPQYTHLSSKVNYILLSDIKPRTRTENVPPHLLNLANESKKGVIDYSAVISALRVKILQLPRHNFPECVEDITELEWFNLSSKLWSRIFHELTSLSEDGASLGTSNLLLDPLEFPNITSWRTHRQRNIERNLATGRGRSGGKKTDRTFYSRKLSPSQQTAKSQQRRWKRSERQKEYYFVERPASPALEE